MFIDVLKRSYTSCHSYQILLLIFCQETGNFKIISDSSWLKVCFFHHPPIYNTFHQYGSIFCFRKYCVDLLYFHKKVLISKKWELKTKMLTVERKYWYVIHYSTYFCFSNKRNMKNDYTIF